MFRYFFGNRRRIAAFLIILGGIGLAVAILLSGNGEGASFLTAFLGTNTGAPSNLNFKLGGISSAVAISSDDAAAADNLTDQVAKAYGAQILSLNEKGMKKANKDAPITIPGDQTLSDIISQGLAQQIAVPTFKAEDIRVGKIDDKKAALAYLKALADAYDQDFTTQENFFLSIAGAIQNNTSALEKNVDATSNFITDLLGISVPPSWENLHIKMLNIWQRRLTLANTILKSSDDPLKAAVALQTISDNLDAEESFLDQFWTTLRTQGIVSTNS